MCIRDRRGCIEEAAKEAIGKKKKLRLYNDEVAKAIKEKKGRIVNTDKARDIHKETETELRV